MKVTVSPPHATRASSESLKQFAIIAEELGYDSLSMSEHIVVPLHVESRYPYTADGKAYWDHEAPWLQGMVALGFIAGFTERIRLTTSIIPVMTRDPLSLAKEAATVDLLSKGRLDLGLGAGWCHEEAAMLGHASDHPNGRLEETIDILRLAWGESSFSYHGRFYDFDEVGVHPQPLRGATTPILIGGQSPRLVQLTRNKADGSVISQRTHMLPELRAALPDKMIRIALHATADFDPAEVFGRAKAFHEQGADDVIVSSADAKDSDGAIRVLNRFAKELLRDVHAMPSERHLAGAC